MDFIHELAQIITTSEFGIISALLILVLPIWLKKFRGAGQIQVIVTTAGMLGTFLGIVAGISLLDLRIDEINASIAQLLGGLTTAFLTSIAGLSASLLIQVKPRGFPYNMSDSNDGKTEKIASLGDVLVELKSLNKNIAGEGDISLTTQIVKMRSENSDNLKELKKSFDDFAEQMAENNTKALIEAVNQVMEDFNAKINDQIGENFRRLSEGVEGLITWQDQYREQISVATVALQESNKAIGVSVESISVMVERAQEFEKTAKELKDSLETMGSSMSGIKALGETLKNSGQDIRDEMEKITKQNIEVLGKNLAGISEKLVADYSNLQRMMETATRSQNSN
ncbi:hypothetical protein COB18_03990 [Candidatus Kaiserbacteria bacterium]|nr:MAG: hypothetical protein COB18_03990 [Candidatus Kaiserbacteria bacterium]